MAAKEAAFEERMAKPPPALQVVVPPQRMRLKRGTDDAAATHENDIDQEELSWGAVARVGEEEQEVKRRSLIGIVRVSVYEERGVEVPGRLHLSCLRRRYLNATVRRNVKLR